MGRRRKPPEGAQALNGWIVLDKPAGVSSAQAVAAVGGSVQYRDDALGYLRALVPTVNIRQLAARDKVSLRMFSVIYELIDDVRGELTKLLPPEIIRTDFGRLIVRGVFKIAKTDVICGGEVTKGKLVVPARASVIRDGETIADVEITNLKRGPQEAKEVQTGEMCGVSFKSESRVDLKEGDQLEFYSIETKERTL